MLLKAIIIVYISALFTVFNPLFWQHLLNVTTIDIYINSVT